MVLVAMICWLLSAFVLLLLVYVVFSWIPRPPEPILPLVRGIDRIMTPLLEPIRRMLPPLRLGGIGLDLSVIVVFFLTAIVQSFLC